MAANVSGDEWGALIDVLKAPAKGDSGNRESILICPICGDDHIHLNSLGRIEDEHGQLREDEDGSVEEDRGDLWLSIGFNGKCGHSFSVMFWTHEGETRAMTNEYGGDAS